MDHRAAILAAVEAYDALLEFNATVPGMERQLRYSAAKRAPGVEERTAWAVADFLPAALSRPLLAARGVQLDDHYGRLDAQGRLRSYRLLADEPVFRAAVELVAEIKRTKPRAAKAIAAIDPSFPLLQTALERGSRAADLGAGPLLLNGPDELCNPLDQQPKFDPTPWWLANLERPRRPW